ncbi:MAG TPA: hypothetical protein VGJ60_07370 [Chloroflexota bacterium]|jgi:hypothetical protein
MARRAAHAEEDRLRDEQDRAEREAAEAEERAAQAEASTIEIGEVRTLPIEAASYAGGVAAWTRDHPND